MEDKIDEILNLVRAQSRASLSISQPDLSSAIGEVNNELILHQIKIPNNRIEDMLRKLIIDYNVPKDEAIKSTINYWLNEKGIELQLARDTQARHSHSKL